MLKRVALAGSIAVVTAVSVPSAGAQYCCGGPVTVTVSTYPQPSYPAYPAYPAYHPYPAYAPYHRDGWWWDDEGPHYHSSRRPPFFYGDRFEPYGYGYRAEAYHLERDGGYGY